MHRPLIVVALLVTAAGAVGALQHESATGPTSIGQSECWSCHAPGLWDPPMKEVGLGVRVEDLDGPHLQAQVENSWTHNVADVRGVATLPRGGAWTFPVDGAPTSGSIQGTVPYQPLTDTTAWVTFDVPEGTQRLSVALEDTSMLEHAIHAEVFSPKQAWMLGPVAAGDGETFGVGTVAAAGWGTYHAKVVRTATSDEPPEDAAFRLRITVDSRPEAGLLVAAEGNLTAGEAAILSWPVEPGHGAAAGEVKFDVFYASWYDHDSANDPDVAALRMQSQTRIDVVDGKVVTQPLAQDPPAAKEAPGAGPLVALAAVGMTAWALRRR